MVIELHRDRAVIETHAGARQTYRRRPVDIGRVVLAWELPTPTAVTALPRLDL
jgi:hypothetical protein